MAFLLARGLKVAGVLIKPENLNVIDKSEVGCLWTFAGTSLLALTSSIFIHVDF